MPSSNEPPRRSHVATGREYEARAAEFLRSKGYIILGCHVQVGHKELDIVAEKDAAIVFVEVKGAGSSSFGHPAEWVTHRKQTRLIAAAERYLHERGLAGRACQFDLITFFEGRLEHFPNAFGAESD